MSKPRIGVVVGAALLLLVSSCGGDDEGGSSSSEAADNQSAESGADDSSDDEGLSDALNDALGNGGGGVLIVDGEEIPIATVTCILDEGSFDAGTVSDNGFRVLATKTRPENDAYAQILDADFVQWFQMDSTGDEVLRDGNTLTSATATYSNNVDDRQVEASFTIECP